MIEYRSFCNFDPPALVKLWHECRLGRGAAEGFSTDALETILFSQTYFDSKGLIVAVDDHRLVGYVHAGFGTNAERTGLAKDVGAICAVMVHPEYRRQGIGRELVKRAERYLTESGSQTILAGPAESASPFYVGLYGGGEVTGFLESDPDAAPFFSAVGYEPIERHLVFQRDIGTVNVPFNIRLQDIRRRMELTISEQPQRAGWWWETRFGRLDTLTLNLTPKEGGPPVASATVVVLDFYLQKWQERSIGITELYVADAERRKGYGQALVLEICRRLRQEMMTRIDAHVSEENTEVLELVKSVGLEHVDTGIVYRRR